MRPLLATLLLVGLAAGQTPETNGTEPPQPGQGTDPATRRTQLRAGVPMDAPPPPGTTLGPGARPPGARPGRSFR